MNNIDLSSFATQVVTQAGQIALNAFQDGPVVARTKADQTLVSDADEATEAFICEAITSQWPEHAIVAEEIAGEMSLEEAHAVLAADYTWVIDPIDGTDNYLAGIPTWCIAIGCLHRGVPAIGTVYFPALNNELYYNIGDTLYRRAGAAGSTRGDEIIFASTWGRSSRPLIMVHDSFCYRYYVDIPHIVRITGCTVLNLMYALLGKAYGAVTSARLWDFAAPLAFANALNCTMTALVSGKKIDRITPETISLCPGDARTTWRLLEPHVVGPSENVERMRASIRPRQ